MHSLTLRQIEVFVRAAEAGSFAHAASELGISQASVSAHVSAIEGQVGGILFLRRAGRNSQLSPLGEVVYRYALRFLRVSREMDEAIGRARQGKSERLVFSCQRSVGTYLQSSLAKFVHMHPTIEFVQRVGTQEQVMKDFQSAAADIACVLSYNEEPEPNFIKIGQLEVVIVASCDHPLANRKGIPSQELTSYPFVGPPTSMFGTSLSRLLHDSGIQDLPFVARANEYQPIRELVMAGVGLSCLFATSVREDVDRGVLSILDVDIPPLLLDVQLGQPTTRKKSRACRLFSQFLLNAENLPPSLVAQFSGDSSRTRLNSEIVRQ